MKVDARREQCDPGDRLLIVGPFSYYWINVARRKKETLRFRIKRIAIAETIFILTAIILAKNGRSSLEAIFFGVMTGSAISFLVSSISEKKSTHSPTCA